VSELVALLSELVAVDSVNPTLVRGGAGEGELARLVANWLDRAGLDVDVHEVAPGRPNVVAVARGTGSGRSLLLDAHVDTVGVEGMSEPFGARVEGGRLYGRGAYDTKAGLAAIMLAAADAGGRRLRGDVIVAAVADEEAASLGTQALVGRVRADAAIVAEPTELGLAVAHKGFVAAEIETRGRAAHGSRYDLGIDAIVRMGRVLVRLAELDESLRRDRPPHPLLGGGSVHASTVEGGRELSTYPDRCLLRLERRTIPGETPALVAEELNALLDGIDGEARVLFHREPLETSPDEPIVRLVADEAARVLGCRPEPVGVPFWTDAALLSAAGIPTVVLGPGGEGAHAEVEWVDLADAERLVEILGAVAAAFCV
jgi:acetylornithine deacetylase